MRLLVASYATPCALGLGRGEGKRFFLSMNPPANCRPLTPPLHCQHTYFVKHKSGKQRQRRAKKDDECERRTKDGFLELCNKWEEWEPEKKSRKDPVRTFWREAEEEKNDTMEEASVDEWWERENMGYTDVTEREPEFYWNSNVRRGTSDDCEDDEVNVNV